MTRDVLIRISGLQAMDGENDNVEVITTGDYFLKNGRHYVIYDEVMEGFEGNIRNMLKISPDKLDVRKNGAANAHMVFEQDRKNLTRYVTPMGEMIVEVSTNRILLDEQEDSLKVSVDYSLDINYSHVSDCNITVDVCSRENARLELQS
ncbi:DUF1934 domain-containing protein [Clostridium sp. AN503]|uniref:DUF1934 domain-containing protein n=1 Tax=Clostridium sp. AN503 TaxID=3160598 RepID=UPI0034590578